MSALYTAENETVRLSVYADECPSSPREWDQLGTIVGWHRRYKLGDEQPREEPHRWLHEWKRGRKEKDYVILPVYMIDHSCVALNTLFILFMIVTGRVLKAAMKARQLSPQFLAELNQFFARKAAYPMALIAATLAVATAVLGHGRFIGVPIAVHFTLGLITVVVNLLGIPASLRVLGENQRLLDRAARELDRLDETEGPVPEGTGEPEWRFGPRARWFIFATSAWAAFF